MTVGHEANGEVLDRPKDLLSQATVRTSRPVPVPGIARSDPLRERVPLGQILREGIEPTPQLLPGLLYEGRLHSIAGAAGDGKTLVALWMALQVIDRGLPVLYFDAENGPVVMAQRLGEMGADPDSLDHLLHYFPSDFTLLPKDLAALKATAVEVEPALVVFDSLADFLGAAELDENSNTDCTRWFAAVAQPLKDLGVAVLVLDHVPKSGKGGPRGASSKVAKMDAQWELEVAQRFDRVRTGEIKLTCKKDRESWLPRTVKLSFGGGVFARSADVRVKSDSKTRLTENEQKVYDAMRKAGEAGARWTDLERAVGGSKGNVTRGLDGLERYDLYDKRDGRYFARASVPETSQLSDVRDGTARYRNGTEVPDGTRVPAEVPSGTTPPRGGTAGTADAENLGGTSSENTGTVRELSGRED